MAITIAPMTDNFADHLVATPVAGKLLDPLYEMALTRLGDECPPYESLTDIALLTPRKGKYDELLAKQDELLVVGLVFRSHDLELSSALAWRPDTHKKRRWRFVNRGMEGHQLIDSGRRSLLLPMDNTYWALLQAVAIAKCFTSRKDLIQYAELMTLVAFLRSKEKGKSKLLLDATASATLQ